MAGSWRFQWFLVDEFVASLRLMRSLLAEEPGHAGHARDIRQVADRR